MKYLDQIYSGSQDIVSELGEKKTIDGTSYYTSEFVYLNKDKFDANKTYSLDVYPFWKDGSNNYYKRTSTAVPAGCEALVGLVNYCFRNKNNGVEVPMTALDVIKTKSKDTWTHQDGNLATKTYTLENFRVNDSSNNSYHIRGSRENIEYEEILDQNKYSSTTKPPYAISYPLQGSSNIHWYGKNLSFSDKYLQFLGSIENSNLDAAKNITLPANSKKIVIGLTIPGNYSLSYDQGITIYDRSTGIFNDHLFTDLRFGNTQGMFSDFSEHKITGRCEISSNSVRFYELDIPAGADTISFDSKKIRFISSNQGLIRLIEYNNLIYPTYKYDSLINTTGASSIDYEKRYNFIEGGYVVPGGGDTARHSYYIAGAEDGWESGAIVWGNSVYGGVYDKEQASFKYRITVQPQSWLINKPTLSISNLDLLNNVIAFDKQGLGNGNNGGIIFEHLLKFKMQLGFNPLQGSLINFGDWTNRYLTGQNSKGDQIKKYCNCSPQKWYNNNGFNLGAIVGVISGWENNSDILSSNSNYKVGQPGTIGYGASVYAIWG